jgi:hypothetical protein
MSGGLFTLATTVRPKGEAFVWSLFGGLALLGWVIALFIRANRLESDEWVHEHGDEDDGNESHRDEA